MEHSEHLAQHSMAISPHVLYNPNEPIKNETAFYLAIIRQYAFAAPKKAVQALNLPRAGRQVCFLFSPKH